jgi:hypothetical protein
MQKLKDIFIKYFFCGTKEQYDEGKIIYTQERLIIRKRWYYWAPVLLLAGSTMYLMFSYQRIDVFVACFIIIFCCIQLVDATAEHLIVKLLRERK